MSRGLIWMVAICVSPRFDKERLGSYRKAVNRNSVTFHVKHAKGVPRTHVMY